VLLKLGERVAGEWILPWGARMQPHVAEIASLAQHAFASLDCEFPASAWRQGGGFVVAGREFGMAPHREQAALVLVELGVRAVLARSFDRGFLRRLAQAGVLPLRLRLESDYHALAAGDELEIPGLPETLEPGKPLVVRNLTRASQHTLPHDLGAREIELIRAGGLLALAQIEAAAADGARA
jgi:aconitate hydratase